VIYLHAIGVFNLSPIFILRVYEMVASIDVDVKFHFTSGAHFCQCANV